MSYDFLMFKPLVEIRAMEDMREDAFALLDGAEVMEQLSRMFPGLQWRRFGEGESHDHFHATHQGAGTWYEFRVWPGSSRDWSISTSHRARERDDIASICRRFGHIAFDGQAMLMIHADGEIPL